MSAVCARLAKSRSMLAVKVAVCQRLRRAPSGGALCSAGAGKDVEADGVGPLVMNDPEHRRDSPSSMESKGWVDRCRSAWHSSASSAAASSSFAGGAGLVDNDYAAQMEDGGSPQMMMMMMMPTMDTVKRRLCSREGWLEIVGFVLWMVLICVHVVQLFGLWWFFWQFVAEDGYDVEKPIPKLALEGITNAAKGGSALAGTLARRAAFRSVAANRAKHAAAFAAWAGWLGGVFLVERPLLKRTMPAVLLSLCYHAELFGAAGLAMTLCTNFASYLHSPGARLFDVGFALVPEIPRNTWLHPLSDVLTGLVPVVTFAYLCLFLDRRRRARAMTDWFRMMTVVYCFRCITSTMTSLPGPAPHCAPRSYRDGDYHPPGTWHDIATSLTTAASGGSCGDLLFSGHAAMTTITTLLLVRQQRRHGARAEKIAKVVGCTYIVLVCLFALAARRHYSVDLALGTLIGSLTYFRFRDSWSRDPVSLDRMEQVARYYSPRHDAALCDHCSQCPARHEPREDVYAHHVHDATVLESKPVARLV